MNFSRAAARARARVRLSVRRRRQSAERATPVAPATPAPRGTMSHAEVRTIFFGLMLAVFLAALNQTIIATALADHRPAFRRLRESVLGGHRLSPDLDGGGAALRQALRHLGPARDDPARHRPVHRGLGDVRRRARHDHADPRPRPARHRRRRHPAALPVGDRRRGRPARARPLPGLHGRGVGDLGRRRAGVRRRAWPSICTGR